MSPIPCCSTVVLGTMRILRPGSTSTDRGKARGIRCCWRCDSSSRWMTMRRISPGMTSRGKPICSSFRMGETVVERTVRMTPPTNGPTPSLWQPNPSWRGGYSRFPSGTPRAQMPTPSIESPRLGGTAYDRHIPASDLDELSEALLDIGDNVFSCGFEVDDPGPDADHRRINLYMNGDVVPFDESCKHHVGWTWDDDAYRRIRLCSEACNALRADDSASVVAKFGCPAVVV
jgi:hypothetical protein